MPSNNRDENDDDDDNDEAVPFVNTNDSWKASSYFQIEGSSSSEDRNAASSAAAHARKIGTVRFRYMMMGIILIMMLILYSKRSGNVLDVDDVDQKNSEVTIHHPTKKATKPKLNIKSLQILQQQFNTAHNEFNDLLKIQYGKYYNDIFVVSGNTSRGSILFESGDAKSTKSKLRLRRKLSMKLLEASAFDYSSSSSKPSSTDSNSTTTKDVQFVWATGGHSATAGHGNFYNESYTAYIQYALTNIFDSVNINFSARRYAMGGTASGSELALCAKEIYGIDYDVLVWDYGMTDGNNYWKQAVYNIRANLLAYRSPIHLSFHAGARHAEGGRYNVVRAMEEMGLGILISNEDVISGAEHAIPDSFGLNEEEIEALPEYIRSYRCGNEIEKGDPYCGRDKFRLFECPDRRFMTSWHPGWKWHALMGYLASHYMIAVLNDALQDLATKLATGIDAAMIYNDLEIEAEQDYDVFQAAPIPKILKDVLPENGVDDFNLTQFMKGPNYCHTTRLPAEIRYLGLLTETTSQIGLANYDTGIDIGELLSGRYVSNTTKMLLSYSKAERPPCPIPTIIDFKDYFYVGAKTGWQQLTLPNPSERAYYYNNDIDHNGVKKHESSSSPPLLYGYVAFCMTACDWGNCPDGVLDIDAFAPKGYIEMQVNGMNVTELVPMDDCVILRHSTGYRFEVNEVDNTLTIQVQVNVPDTERANSYVRFSSWIVW